MEEARCCQAYVDWIEPVSDKRFKNVNDLHTAAHIESCTSYRSE